MLCSTFAFKALHYLQLQPTMASLAVPSPWRTFLVVSCGSKGHSNGKRISDLGKGPKRRSWLKWAMDTYAQPLLLRDSYRKTPNFLPNSA